MEKLTAPANPTISTPPTSASERILAGLAILMKPLVAAQDALDTACAGTAGVTVRWVYALLMGITIVWSFKVPESPMFLHPELARIFFWHFPCPIIASVLLLQGAWYSFRYLATYDLAWDVKAISALELGMIFSILTMLTGVLFSKVQWNGWWQSDPRQTSFLLVLILYFAYFVLRGAFPDRERRAANSAGYSLAATLPTLFLIFVFPRLPHIAEASMHPTQTIWEGQVHGSYAYVITATMTLGGFLAIWLFRLRMRAGLLELNTYGTLGLEDHRGGAAVTPVVRPVRLPSGD